MTVYKMIDIVGTSGTSISDAIRGAVHKASETVDDLQWFEVTEIRGRVDRDEVAEYQVKMKLAFRVHAHGEVPSEEPASRKTGTRGTRTVAAQTAAKKGQKGRADLAKGFREKSR